MVKELNEQIAARDSELAAAKREIDQLQKRCRIAEQGFSVSLVATLNVMNLQ